MRYAIRLFYLGANYHGFQLQNDLETIEKRIYEALIEAGYLKKKKTFMYSSRTDKGVDAFEQTIAFDTDERLIIPKINTHLPPDIIAWASTPVDLEFSPRFHAISRSYIYTRKFNNDNIEIMREASKLFIGTHDLRNFCKYKNGMMTKRTINEIYIHENAGFLKFLIKAPSFLHQQVRRIVNCLMMTSSGKMQVEDIKSLFTEDLVDKRRIAPAPIDKGGSLILSAIEYPYKFKIDSHGFEKVHRYLNKLLNYHSLSANVFASYLNLHENTSYCLETKNPSELE